LSDEVAQRQYAQEYSECYWRRELLTFEEYTGIHRSSTSSNASTSFEGSLVDLNPPKSIISRESRKKRKIDSEHDGLCEDEKESQETFTSIRRKRSSYVKYNENVSDDESTCDNDDDVSDNESNESPSFDDDTDDYVDESDDDASDSEEEDDHDTSNGDDEDEYDDDGDDDSNDNDDDCDDNDNDDRNSDNSEK
jgi:hypothetical protein